MTNTTTDNDKLKEFLGSLHINPNDYCLSDFLKENAVMLHQIWFLNRAYWYALESGDGKVPNYSDWAEDWYFEMKNMGMSRMDMKQEMEEAYTRYIQIMSEERKKQLGNMPYVRVFLNEEETDRLGGYFDKKLGYGLLVFNKDDGEFRVGVASTGDGYVSTAQIPEEVANKLILVYDIVWEIEADKLKDIMSKVSIDDASEIASRCFGIDRNVFPRLSKNEWESYIDTAMEFSSCITKINEAIYDFPPLRFEFPDLEKAIIFPTDIAEKVLSADIAERREMVINYMADKYENNFYGCQIYAYDENVREIEEVSYDDR